MAEPEYPSLVVDDRIRGSLDAVYRRERPQILAVLIRHTGDFSLAEDVVQEAFERALVHWSEAGIPPRPGAWITTTARRLAIDAARRSRTIRRHQASILELGVDDATSAEPVMLPGEDAPHDDRLRLIFTCCHPALSLESQVALTLRMVGGLTTREIARTFLAQDSTMAQRLTRAKEKIRQAGIPFRVPPRPDFTERLDAVLAVIYLVFTEGYASTRDAGLIREDLCGEAIRLCRLLRELLPDHADVEGLLALMLLHASRGKARLGPAGDLVTLERQDRTLWDRAMIEEGTALVEVALRRGYAGPYQIQAAIAALHSEAASAEDTDWPQIAALYALLLKRQPSAVVALNHAVAVGMAAGPAAGLALLDRLDTQGGLDGYHLLEAARAELSARQGDRAEAERRFRRALESCTNPVERAHLERRLAEVRNLS